MQSKKQPNIRKGWRLMIIQANILGKLFRIISGDKVLPIIPWADCLRTAQEHGMRYIKILLRLIKYMPKLLMR